MLGDYDIVYDMSEYSSEISRCTSELYRLKKLRDESKNSSERLNLEYKMISLQNLLNGLRREYQREFF